MKLKPIRFIKSIWDHTCSTGDTTFLSTKSLNGNWSDHRFKYGKNIREKLKDWFDSHSPKKYDIYFCPLPFKGKKRDRDQVKGLNILWADIDHGDTHKIKPTFLWSSSPERYQGLWLLDKKCDVEKIERLNKDLAYHIDADRGGWDLTQVLRVPGTINHKEEYKEKYGRNPKVGGLENSNKVFKFNKLRKDIPQFKKKKDKEESIIDYGKISLLVKKHKNKISPDIKRKLLSRKAMGDRSKVLWSLENKLFEQGVPAKDIVNLIKYSIWNKFRGRSNEDELLVREIDKIVKDSDIDTDVDIEEEPIKSGLRIESYDNIMSSLDTYPGWLVEGFWLNNSHGIVAGEPKTFKSTLALDFAISVASGRNFLGKYMVHTQGPVIYIQNENAKWIMKDRIEKISYSKGLGGRAKVKRDGNLIFKTPPNIPLHFINTQSYLLNDPNHREITREIMKQYKPKLIIFDPLYLMYDGDINSAQELNPILGWLLSLKQEFNCAIMLIHHWNKGNKNNNGSRGGQRMLGSTTLHGWIESAWYVRTEGDQDQDQDDSTDINKAKAKSSIVIEREFRGAGVHPKASLSLTMGGVGSSEYSIDTKVYHGSGTGKKSNLEEIDGRILNFLLVQKESVSVRYISKELGISRTLAREATDRLVSSGVVDEISKGVYSALQ